MSVGEIVQLEFSEGINTNPPTQTILGSVSSFVVYANDAAFVAAKGSAAALGDSYISTDGHIHFYDGTRWIEVDESVDVRVYNDTGVQILKGTPVYISGSDTDAPTVALSKSDALVTAHCLGLTKELIGVGAYGLVVTMGLVTNVDTSSYAASDELWVSDSTAGELTNVKPTAPGSLHSQAGIAVVIDAVLGSIYVSANFLTTLNDISNVKITSPTLDQTLRYNGVEWVNGAASTSSAGAGISFFNATPNIIAAGVLNDVAINSLSKTPVTTAEQTISATAVSNTVAGFAWLYNTALGRTSIDAGLWSFTTYAAVNSVAGGRVTTLTRTMYKVSPYTSPTVTTTGAGTSRTATASSGTPFAVTKIDASATNTDASYLQTPTGLYQITARTSDTVVTILVPAGYVNETTIAFSVWKKLFASTSSPITSTGTNYAAQDFTSAQAAFTILETDKLGTISFVTSNNTTTLTLTYDGTTRNTHFQTPLITLHNNLAGLQGGSANEQYHHDLAEYTRNNTAASTTDDGYLTSTDWNTFNNKPDGGGGPQLVWRNDGLYAWGEGTYKKQLMYNAYKGGTQKLYTWITVGSTYTAGTPINLKAHILSDVGSGNILLTAVSTLIRAASADLDDTDDQHTSTNAAQTISAANKPYQITMDITDGGGQINGINLVSGDVILIEITRGTDTCTGYCYLPPSSFEAAIG